MPSAIHIHGWSARRCGVPAPPTHHSIYFRGSLLDATSGGGHGCSREAAAGFGSTGSDTSGEVQHHLWKRNRWEGGKVSSSVGLAES